MTQAQPNLLELAKQGNAKAIAALINRQLQPKGITAAAIRTHKDSCPQMLLKAANIGQTLIQTVLTSRTEKLALMSGSTHGSKF
jgi:hypothetical protein